MGQLLVKESVAEYLHQIASAKGEKEEKVLEEALQLYWRVFERQKIEAEDEAWRAMPVAERAKYAGQWVAVHEGHVIDHDSDDAAFCRRIRERYGNTPIMIVEGGELGLGDTVTHGLRYERDV